MFNANIVSFSVIELFTFSSTLTLFILSVLLFLKNREQRKVNLLLVLAFASQLMVSFIVFLLETRTIHFIPYLLRIDVFTLFLTAPLLYLYIIRLFNPGISLRKTAWLHFIPATLQLVYIIPSLLLSSEQTKQLLSEAVFNRSMYIIKGTSPFTYYYAEIATFLGLFYLVYLVVYIEKHKSRVKTVNYYRWARWLIWNATGVFTVVIVVFACYFLEVLSARSAQNVFLVSSNFFFFSLLVFFLVNTDELRLDSQREEPEETVPDENGLSEKDLEVLNEVVEYLEKEKPFLEPKFSLVQLANDTGVSRNYLSELINKQYQVSFTVFINQLRIEYLRKNLTQDDISSLTLEGIAFKAGFQSRTTFLNATKKTLGLTPKEFIRQISEEKSK